MFPSLVDFVPVLLSACTELQVFLQITGGLQCFTCRFCCDEKTAVITVLFPAEFSMFRHLVEKCFGR